MPIQKPSRAVNPKLLSTLRPFLSAQRLAAYASRGCRTMHVAVAISGAIRGRDATRTYWSDGPWKPYRCTPLCAQERPKHRQQLRVYGPRWTLHGHAARALDPGVVLHLFQGVGLSAKEVEGVLYKKSGLLGISGISNDMRDLLKSDEPAAQLALNISSIVPLKRSERSRLRSVALMDWCSPQALARTRLRFVDESASPRRGSASSWTPQPTGRTARDLDSREWASASVIPTNEELMIARHTGLLLGLTAGGSVAAKA